eukprot:NODE_1670_length_1449_cov_43.055714_g858_i1.p1 GENE.NODE_1670_length_1449_cov_43.055714_g858_i1~~NODE_1670_length_1449_cov_43.055714_g858_i1.p1  ORF type:complete len:264 (+),score=62.89 NODE_1670_length_1449_cov_43.055714_g858_i1:454-1245(+)
MATIDGVELVDEEWALLAQGKVYAPPLIIGFNRDEGAAFDSTVKMDEKTYRQRVRTLFPNLDGSQMESKICNELYPSNAYKWIPGISKPYRAFIHVYGDFAFSCASRRSVRNFAKMNAGNVWFYEFEKYRKIPGQEWLGPLFAYHAAELEYVFQKYGSVENPDLSKEMGKYWSSFARNSVPTGSVQWPAFRMDNQKYLSFDDKITVKSNVLQGQCDFWDSVWLKLAPGCTLPTGAGESRNATSKQSEDEQQAIRDLQHLRRRL